MEAVRVGPVPVGPVLVAFERPDGAQNAHSTGRALLAELLDVLGAPGEVTAHCDVCGSDAHGRPVTAGALLSVSYAPGWVVAAAAPAAAGRAVGVDVEAQREAGPMRELAALFAPHEPPDLRGWTSIEAAVKADGRGLRIPPHRVTLTGERGRILPGGRRIAVPGRGTRIEVAPVVAPAGLVVSVAIDPGSGSER